jgi:hypothetical protein
MGYYRLLRLVVVVLALRLALDIATPLAPGAFALQSSGGIEGSDAWNVRVAETMARGAPARVAVATPFASAPLSATVARSQPVAPTRRIEHPLRLPTRTPAPASSSSDSPAAH